MAKKDLHSGGRLRTAFIAVLPTSKNYKRTFCSSNILLRNTQLRQRTLHFPMALHEPGVAGGREERFPGLQTTHVLQLFRANTCETDIQTHINKTQT